MYFDPNWRIRPLAGLGPLEFGMSEDAVAAHDAVFGIAQRRVDEQASIEGVLATLAPFADTVPGIRENMEAMKRDAESSFTEYRQDSFLILKYSKHKLSEIAIGSGCVLLNIEETSPFAEPSGDVLQKLARLNGGALFLNPSVLFDRIGLFLQSFLQVDDAGNLTLTSPKPGFRDDRTVVIAQKQSVADQRKLYSLIKL
jgi:hypothetical protein